MANNIYRVVSSKAFRIDYAICIVRWSHHRLPLGELKTSRKFSIDMQSKVGLPIRSGKYGLKLTISPLLFCGITTHVRLSGAKCTIAQLRCVIRWDK